MLEDWNGFVSRSLIFQIKFPSQSDETHSLFYQSENEKSPLSRDRDMKFLREWTIFSCKKDSFLPVSTPPTLTPGHGMYSNFCKYAHPSFLPQICPPFFWGQFSQNSLVGDAWLKASLVLQHTLYYPPKSWALLVPKYGRAVKSIYSHNLFSS